MSWTAISRREKKFVTFAKWAIVALFAKVLVSILFEYTRYFPADFSSDFLSGRRDYFYGLYGVAFYVHIISGPLALIAGAFLMFSGTRIRFQKLHRSLGKLQAVIVIALVVPSGLVMATKSIAGPAAGVGLGLHGLVTAACMCLAIYFATRRQLARHRRWATRCFLLLCAPLVLRLINGAAITSGFETESIYIVNAWASWIAPLVAYESFRMRKRKRNGNAVFPVASLITHWFKRGRLNESKITNHT